MMKELERLDDEHAFRSFKGFVEVFWSEVEPQPFKDNWHIDAICDHLEALQKRQILRLLINIPPRHSKSLLVSVLFPAWCWLHDPVEQFLTTSYAGNLATRDARRSRLVMQKPRFMNLIRTKHPSFEWAGDQNVKSKYENNLQGYRMATGVRGQLTGDGGSIIIVDDANNVKETESKATREATIQWWDEALSTRHNDAVTGCTAVVQQRTHQEDLTGHILKEEGDDWNQLILPMEYEGKNRCRSTINFVDPRKKKGELLNPVRFPKEAVERIAKKLGAYGKAGQFQQTPAPRKGGELPTEKIVIIKEEQIQKSNIIEIVRYWDKAGSEGKGDFTAGVKMCLMKSGRTIILDVKRGQWGISKRNAIIKQTAQVDGTGVNVWVEQEGGSSGKESAEITIKELAGFNVKAERPTGEKTARAEPFASQMEAGNVYMVKADWNKDYLDELRLFPAGSHDDQVDGSSGGFNKLHARQTGVTW